MTKQYTDQQLQLTLAKMLPRKVLWNINGESSRPYNREGFFWICVYDENHLYRRVHQTEWLHICWLIEQTFNKTQQEQFTNALYSLTWPKAVHSELDFKTVSATWQLRAIALSQTLRIPIQ